MNENGTRGEWEEKEGPRDRRKERTRCVGNGMEKIKIVFWNVAGLKNKDAEFWENVREWDVMVMMQTWVDEKS